MKVIFVKKNSLFIYADYSGFTYEKSTKYDLNRIQPETVGTVSLLGTKSQRKIIGIIKTTSTDT
jgi:hypothetical protein